MNRSDALMSSETAAVVASQRTEALRIRVVRCRYMIYNGLWLYLVYLS